MVFFEILLINIFKNILFTINTYKITHLMILIFLYYSCTYKLDLRFAHLFDQQCAFEYDEYTIDFDILNNTIINTQNKKNQNINFDNNLSNANFYDNWDLFAECNTQSSSSIRFLSNWLEIFNGSTQTYLFMYVSRMVLIVYTLILLNLLKFYFIRKIY